MTVTSALPATHSEFAPVGPAWCPVVEEGRGLTVSLIASACEWRHHNSDWEEITARHPLHGQAWLRSWWEELGKHQGQLAIARIHDEDRVVGFAPFFKEKTWLGTTLKFLGGGPTCTDYLDIFCRDGAASKVARALSRWIASAEFHAKFGTIDLIELEGHRANAPGVTAFQDVLAHNGWTEEIAALQSCWVVSFPPTWDEFVLHLSHRGRRRARNAMKSIQSGATTLHIWDQYDDVVANWQIFVELHQKRRHQKGEAGCFAEGNFESFLRRACFRLAEQGQASLVAIRFGDQIIAMALQLHGLGTTYLYQTGMDSDFIKLEPGHLINATMLHAAQSQGITQFDFLRGNEPYKARWNAQPVPLVRTRLWNPRPTAQVRAHLMSVGRCVKQWFQSDSASNNKEQD